MDEFIKINGVLCKLSSNTDLTQQQMYNVIMKASNIYKPQNNVTMNTMANTPLEGATVTITGSGPVATPSWVGTTDVAGIAKNVDGTPKLTYGNYTVVASKIGYSTSAPVPFIIPDDSAKTIRITIIGQEIVITITD